MRCCETRCCETRCCGTRCCETRCCKTRCSRRGAAKREGYQSMRAAERVAECAGGRACGRQSSDARARSYRGWLARSAYAASARSCWNSKSDLQGARAQCKHDDDDGMDQTGEVSGRGEDLPVHSAKPSSSGRRSLRSASVTSLSKLNFSNSTNLFKSTNN